MFEGSVSDTLIGTSILVVSEGIRGLVLAFVRGCSIRRGSCMRGLTVCIKRCYKGFTMRLMRQLRLPYSLYQYYYGEY